MKKVHKKRKKNLPNAKKSAILVFAVTLIAVKREVAAYCESGLWVFRGANVKKVRKQDDRRNWRQVTVQEYISAKGR